MWCNSLRDGTDTNRKDKAGLGCVCPYITARDVEHRATQRRGMSAWNRESLPLLRSFDQSPPAPSGTVILYSGVRSGALHTIQQSGHPL